MIVTPGSDTPPGLLAIEDAERLQGFEIGHTWPCLRTEGGVSRDLTPEAHERARFALVGDAVSVPVAWYIGKRLANPYEGRKYTSGNGDRAFDPAAPEVRNLALSRDHDRPCERLQNRPTELALSCGGVTVP